MTTSDSSIGVFATILYFFADFEVASLAEWLAQVVADEVWII